MEEPPPPTISRQTRFPPPAPPPFPRSLSSQSAIHTLHFVGAAADESRVVVQSSVV